MDYFDILKRAWKITWRYKALWVLGLFAGAASSSTSSGTRGYQTGSSGNGSTPDFGGIERQFTDWVSQNALLIAVIAGVLAIIGIAFWILSVAAQGGLVYGANEAAEDRKPVLGRSWSVGFSKWGRTFMTSFVLSLPIAVVIGVIAAIGIAAGVGGALAAGGDSSSAGGAIGLILGSLCLFIPLLIVVIIAASIILGIVYPLALRHGVLEDMTFGKAIRAGWNDLWGKRGAFVFWLVMLLPGVAFGAVAFIVVLPFVVPAVLLLVAGKYIAGIALFFVMGLVMLLPNAIYATFVSSAWTVFFRQMTGIEPRKTVTTSYTSTQTYTYAPTAPPAAPAPPAPPAPPAAPAEEPPPAPPVVDVTPPSPEPPAPPAEEAPPSDE